MGHTPGIASVPTGSPDRLSKPTELIMQLRDNLETNHNRMLELERRLAVISLPSKPEEALKALEEPNTKGEVSADSPLIHQLRDLAETISAQSIILTRIVEGLDL